MAIFFKRCTSSVASFPLHRHVSPKLSPPPFPLFISFFSTSIAAAANGTPNNNNPQTDKTHSQPQNALLQFLLSECGLSQAQLPATARASLANKRSAETAQRVVQLFRDSGFTEDQVRKIIVRNPCVLGLKSDRLKAKIEFLKKTFCVSGKDMGKALCKALRLLTCNLEKNTIPKIQYLQSLFASKGELTVPLKRATGIINRELDRGIKPSVDILQHSGVQGELLSILLSKDPTILSRSTESLKFVVEYVRNMGISQVSKAFVHALVVVHQSRPETLETKLKLLASFGLLEVEIQELTSKCPPVLNTSIDKMQKIMDFLIHTAGHPANIIVMYPSLLNYSLETRIKPRYAVFKFISEMQLYKRYPSFAAFIYLGEQRFLDKYMKDSPHATRLLDIYSGKSV